ncbi:MAG: hypothetical protein J6D12_05730 [Peptostreptococcaceae bacterium]|nr:hypothetical protein [Peptostreptococcaceae bacterium]
MKKVIIVNTIKLGCYGKDLRSKDMKNLKMILDDNKLIYTYNKANKMFYVLIDCLTTYKAVENIYNNFMIDYDKVFIEVYVPADTTEDGLYIIGLIEEEQDELKMDLQLLARKSVVEQATEAGFKVENSIQANIVNNINGLNKSSITISGNQKTGEIPCINLPNIQVQKDFLQVVKNNEQLLEMEAVSTLYNYMLFNPMCVNCGSCKDACYNNQAYRQYPTKAIADLRTLYNLINTPLETVGTIAQRTRNLRVVRLNGSGEIHNKAILDNYIKLAKLNPLTTYYTYTKNYKLLEGKKLPKNLIINISQFGNMSIDMTKYTKNTNVFKTVTQKEFDATIEDKKVKKCVNDCSSCNYCYTKKGFTILVPIHGSDANKATL